MHSGCHGMLMQCKYLTKKKTKSTLTQLPKEQQQKKREKKTASLVGPSRFDFNT